MDWIHCNTCFNQPRSRSDIDFILTSCGHIFCKKCENRDVVDSCSVCNASCMATKLTSNLKPEVRPYFEDLGNILKMANETYRFQKTHRMNLLKKHLRTVENYQRAKAENQYLRRKNAAIMRKLEAYERRNPNQTPERLDRAIPAKTDFYFTPKMNLQNPSPSPILHGTSASSQGSTRPNQQRITFQQPNLEVYQRYRNSVQRTPGETPEYGTPDRFARQFGKLVNSTSMSGPQSNLPIRTPPYNGLRGMTIRERK